MTTDRTGDAGRLRLLARAKLNVSLRVLAREESGYHSIETIMLRLELADCVELEATIDPGVRLEVEGDCMVPADSSNLCWRAAEVLRREAAPRGGVRIGLDKRIPAGAGLGGGSADAAAVLRGLNELWGRPLDEPALVRLAGEIGSDVPFGLCEAPMALAWEHGRRLLPLEAPPPHSVLIVVPGYPIGAGEAYGWLAEDRSAGLAEPPDPGFLPWAAQLSEGSVLGSLAMNDLEEPVFRRRPELGRIRDQLTDRGADIALLCGSGSCVAGLFSDESLLDGAEDWFSRVEGVSTIRTRTLR